MRDSTENRTSGAFEKSRGPSATFTWHKAQRMLPLVRHIVADLVPLQQQLVRMQTEKEHLDENRRSLAWPKRSRRYQLEEEVAAAEQNRRAVLAELEGLGVVVVAANEGRVGFPTMVNNRPAFFSWQPGDEGLLHWHFADDPTRQPIPESWTKSEPRPRRASRSGPRS
jgi:hypothetical protein